MASNLPIMIRQIKNQVEDQMTTKQKEAIENINKIISDTKNKSNVNNIRCISKSKRDHSCS